MSTQMENLATKHARAQRLRYLREKVLNMSRSEFSGLSKIPRGSLENWEYARHGGLTLYAAIRIMEACKNIGVFGDHDWLMKGVGVFPSTESNKDNNTLIKKVTVGNRLGREEIEKELSLFQNHYPTLITTVIQDNCMLPYFHPGDYVAGLSYKGSFIKKACGQTCIVKYGKGELMVRSLKEADKQHFLLEGPNPLLSTSTEVVNKNKLILVAPIVWMRRPIVFAFSEERESNRTEIS